MAVLVVTPTYNELENIRQLVPLLLALRDDVEVLVVDDNSPDGTGQYVEDLSRQDTRVHVLRRPGKMGLGTAYEDGFRWALGTGRYEYVVQMDADFSHDPARIPEFLDALQEHDVVVGSRYLNGISVVNWPLKRLMLSYFANWYARTLTGLRIMDCTGGFKGFRSAVLAAIPFRHITSDGYAFQIEVNYFCQKLGFSMVEVPIIFIDRRSGTSKLSRRIVYEAVFKVLYLFVDRYCNILRP